MNPSELERQRLAELLGTVPVGVECAVVKLTDDGLPDEVVCEGGGGVVAVRFVPKESS